MSETTNDIERDFMVLVCQDDKAFLEAINRSVPVSVFQNKDNKDLLTLLRQYFRRYNVLPTNEELIVFARTADGISDAQREKSTLYYQELLVEDKPNTSISTLIDALFNLYKKEAAKQIALRLADEKNQQNMGETLDKMIADFTRIKNMGNKEESIADYKSNVEERAVKYQRAKDRKNSGGMLYCFPTLNRITGGQDKGTLWIIRGRSESG